MVTPFRVKPFQFFALPPLPTIRNHTAHKRGYMDANHDNPKPARPDRGWR